MLKLFKFLGLLLVTPTALALSLGDVSENAMIPVSIVTKMLFLACYIVGFMFLISSIMQYQMFRANPKIAPLSRIILLAFFGILFACLPILSVKLGDTESWSATERARNADMARPLNVNIKY